MLSLLIYSYILLALFFLIYEIYEHTKFYNLYLSDLSIMVFRSLFFVICIANIIAGKISKAITYLDKNPLIKSRDK